MSLYQNGRRVYRSLILEMVFLHQPSIWWACHPLHILLPSIECRFRQKSWLESTIETIRSTWHSILDSINYMPYICLAMGWVIVPMGQRPDHCFVCGFRCDIHCIPRNPSVAERSSNNSSSLDEESKRMGSCLVWGLHLLGDLCFHVLREWSL